MLSYRAGRCRSVDASSTRAQLCNVRESFQHRVRRVEHRVAYSRAALMFLQMLNVWFIVCLSCTRRFLKERSHRHGLSQ